VASERDHGGSRAWARVPRGSNVAGAYEPLILVNELGYLYSAHVAWKALAEQLISATSERNVFIA